MDEIRSFIEEAGMEVVETLGNYDGTPFSDTGEGGDVIMVARLRSPNRLSGRKR